MVPQNLSRPSRIGTGNCDHVFVCIYRNKDLQEAGGLCWKQGSGSICLSRFADCPTTETQVEKTLKGFCSGNIARQTRPFWAKVGDSPFANLSRTFRKWYHFGKLPLYHLQRRLRPWHCCDFQSFWWHGIIGFPSKKQLHPRNRAITSCFTVVDPQGFSWFSPKRWKPKMFFYPNDLLHGFHSFLLIG